MAERFVTEGAETAIILTEYVLPDKVAVHTTVYVFPITKLEIFELESVVLENVKPAVFVQEPLGLFRHKNADLFPLECE